MVAICLDPHAVASAVRQTILCYVSNLEDVIRLVLLLATETFHCFQRTGLDSA